MDDILFRFEFDEAFELNAIVVRANSFIDAFSKISLFCNSHVIRFHLISVHKLN